MSFKDSLLADIHNVFLNDDEFAEMHSIKYDGVEYSNVKMVLTKVTELERTVQTMEGVHRVTNLCSFALSSVIDRPEQDTVIQISNGVAAGLPFYEKYKVVTSQIELGMIRLELEAYDD